MKRRKLGSHGRAIAKTPIKTDTFGGFPNLKDSAHIVASEPDKKYNCVAYSLGIRNRWRWVTLDGRWITRKTDTQEDVSVDAFIKAYAAEGFVVCADGRFEIGSQKVAIYVKDGFVAHVAVQRSDRMGRWFSKLGEEHDIEHDLSDLANGDYGEVAVFLRRTKSVRR